MARKRDLKDEVKRLQTKVRQLESEADTRDFNDAVIAMSNGTQEIMKVFEYFRDSHGKVDVMKTTEAAIMLEQAIDNASKEKDVDFYKLIYMLANHGIGYRACIKVLRMFVHIDIAKMARF